MRYVINTKAGKKLNCFLLMVAMILFSRIFFFFILKGQSCQREMSFISYLWWSTCVFHIYDVSITRYIFHSQGRPSDI